MKNLTWEVLGQQQLKTVAIAGRRGDETGLDKVPLVVITTLCGLCVRVETHLIQNVAAHLLRNADLPCTDLYFAVIYNDTWWLCCTLKRGTP
jgi:hypothetical protein